MSVESISQLSAETAGACVITIIPNGNRERSVQRRVDPLHRRNVLRR